MNQPPPAPPAQHEPRLNPVVQARLAEQRREELAAEQRSKRIRVFVVLPVLLVVLAGSCVLALSSDMTKALLGQVVGSTLLFGMWAGRKQIAAWFQ